MRRFIPTALLCGIYVAITGCGDETPTRAFDSEDQALAVMTSAIAGFQSGGITSMIGDIAGGALADSLTQPLPDLRPAAIMGVPGSITGRQIVLRRANGAGDNVSEATLRYFVQSSHGAQIAPREPVAIRTSCEGVVSNESVRINALSEGEIIISGLGVASSMQLSGEIRTGGSPTFSGASTRPFSDISATLSWTDLLVRRGADGMPRMSGVMALSIRANGARGTITRSGSITFNGTSQAMLSLGGKEFVIDIGRSRLAS